METKEYLNKAKEMLNEIDSIICNPQAYMSELGIININDWKRKFIHLVYSFDSHLPLNKEVDSISSIVTYSDCGNKLKEIKKLVVFFIDYIEKYSTQAKTI